MRNPLDMNVTLDHIRQAVLWAEGKLKETPDNLKAALYNQCTWATNVDVSNKIQTIANIISEWNDDNCTAQQASERIELAMKFECGTACCLWGAAYMLANGVRATDGPSFDWKQQSELHHELVIYSFLTTSPQRALDMAKVMLGML